MLKTVFRRMANRLKILLPRTIAERYPLNEGERLHCREIEEEVVLTPFRPEHATWAKTYERTNGKYKNVLKALSK